MPDKTYLCIDLKSFYASVECADRGLDPFTTNLVVADPERSRTTICLAITPAMKKLGVRNRCRVFEIPDGIDYLIAVPRMHRYMEVSSQIYAVYLRYVSPEDMHVYSIDECFIDATPYLALYRTDAKSFARMLMDEVMRETGICATAGIGTNLFLCKLALDVTAKHVRDNIGWLDEQAFMKELWFHRPITDVWGIGPGIARRLARHGAQDLAGVAALREETLYREFGVNAEYLIDHAWGQEPCTIRQIRDYVPERRSLGNGQVLPCDYTAEEAHAVLREMVDASVLDLTEKRLAAEGIALYIGYAREKGQAYAGPVRSLAAGPGAAAGSRKLGRTTNSGSHLWKAFDALFHEIIDPRRKIRRINLAFEGLRAERYASATLFDDVQALEEERSLQRAVCAVRGKFGKNAMLKGTSLKEKATARERNRQIGGHRA